jgi:hypothetical protein
MSAEFVAAIIAVVSTVAFVLLLPTRPTRVRRRKRELDRRRRHVGVRPAHVVEAGREGAGLSPRPDLSLRPPAGTDTRPAGRTPR